MNQSIRISEIQEFLRFVAEDWPRLRVKVKDQLANRCAHCILSEKCVRLSNGVCELCLAQQRVVSRDRDEKRDTIRLERELRKVLNQHSGKGIGNYDAVVLFSGGKDSAFLLYRLRNDFEDLRLLALTIDNGFFSRIAMANCHRILERISGVDHIVFKPDHTLFVKTFRHAFTHLNAGGCYTTVDRLDGDLTFDIGRNLAASLHIPLLIAGLSPEQVKAIIGLQSFETRPEDERQSRTHSAGFHLANLYTPKELRKYWWSGCDWGSDQIPRVLFPYYAWDYDEDVIRRIVSELELIEPGQENPLITNNDTIPLMLSVDVCKLGYSSFEPEFAQLVRRGKAERAPWLGLFESLTYLSEHGRFLPRSIAETLNRLQLSHRDVGLPPPIYDGEPKIADFK